MNCPVIIHPDFRSDALLQVPLNPGFAESCILSRKIGEVPERAESQKSHSQLYPKH